MSANAKSPLLAEAERRAAAEQLPPHGRLPASHSLTPRVSGWTPQAVGSFILAPLLAALTAWAMRTPPAPPDAPTRAEIAQLREAVAASAVEVAAARLDCGVARDNAITARSQSAGASQVADSAVKPKKHP